MYVGFPAAVLLARKNASVGSRVIIKTIKIRVNSDDDVQQRSSPTNIQRNLALVEHTRAIIGFSARERSFGARFHSPLTKHTPVSFPKRNAYP